eukprot:4871238-Pyramimonas_sp.AAC.1
MSHVQNLSSGMREEGDARVILVSLGCGSCFLNVLIRRALYVSIRLLRPHLVNDWNLHYLGDGADMACRWLAGEKCTLQSMVALYSSLRPLFVWVVEAVL